MMDTKALYRRRQAEFLKEIRPYLHYAMQSIAIAAGISFLLFSFGYRQFLQWVTPEFPWQLAATICMLALLVGGRIRTYLQQADTLFLLPQESAMSAYLQSAMRRASIVQAIIITIAWLLVWPMYHKLAPSSGWLFLLLLIVWLVFKQVMLFGKWTELQLQEQRTRLWFMLLRWLLCAILTYAVFALGPAYGIGLLAAGSIAYLGMLRLPRQHKVHWSLLIDMELRHKASIYRMLNLFIDVPELQGKARNIRWLNGCVRLIPFGRKGAYSYLYTLVWLRSELFGITSRFAVIGFFLIAAFDNNVFIAVLFMGIACFSAIQLADLKRYYRENLWQHIYPLPPMLRNRSVNTVRLVIHLMAVVLIAIPAFFTMSSPAYAAGMLLIAVIGSLLYHRFSFR
jgi:ABC-2 type transport system permease protein